MKHCAVIVAGGVGNRMGADMPKQFLKVAEKPILVHTIEKFLQADAQAEIVVVMHSDYIAFWQEIQTSFFPDNKQIQVVAGGNTRTESVANGLAHLKKMNGLTAVVVAIHDAVRMLVSPTLITECWNLAKIHKAVIPTVAVKSSLRKLVSEGSIPVDRAQFVEVQTPQTFLFSEIWAAFEKRKHQDYSDDASLYQSLTGNSIHLATGEYLNFKITTPEDLLLAESLL